MSRYHCLPAQPATAKHGPKKRGFSFAHLVPIRPWGATLLSSMMARLRPVAGTRTDTPAQPREICLAAGETRSLHAAPGTAVVCRGGIVWLTQGGNASDIVLHPGQEFHCMVAAHIVLSPLRGAAQVRIEA